MLKMDALSSVRNTAFVSADCNTFENSMDILAYNKMYNILFNAVTDAIKEIQNAEAILCKAQKNCEEIFMEMVDTESPV